ncbi:MAG: adenosine kinase, partial [Parachlamydiaceae bacterium]
MAKVVAVGSPVIDYLTFVRELEFPKGGMIAASYQEFESLYRKHKWNLCSGGSATNTLKGLSKLGHDCTLIGKIGMDEPALYFIQHAQEIGIKTVLAESRTPSTQALVFITPDGERTFRTFLGAGSELKPYDLKAAFFQDADLLHLEGYIFNADKVAEKAASLIPSKTLISLDLSSYETVQLHQNRLESFISEHVDILFANRLEAFEFTRQNPEISAKKLQELVNTVVINDTERGWYVGTEG